MSRAPAAVVLALLALGAAAPAARAHAVLVQAQPSDGTAVTQAPRQLRLRFSEDLSPRFRRVHLLDGRGRVVSGTRLGAGPDARQLVLSVPRLRRGTYELAWEVLAEADGHVTGGLLAFGVATRAPAAAGAQGAPGSGGPPFETALRWLDLALLALVLGGLTLSRLIAGTVSAGRVPAIVAAASTRRVLLAAAWSGGLAVALGIALLVRQADALEGTLRAGGSAGDALDGTLGDALGRLLGARWGTLWLIREALLAGLCGAALVLSRRAGMRTGRVYAAAAALAVGVAVTRALGSHAAAAPGSAAAVAAGALHVLAACAWIGSIVALMIALSAAGGEARALGGALRRPFAWTAGLSVLSLAVTGLYAAGAQVASVDALLETFYGRTLLAKAGLVLLAGALGLANAALLRRVARPRLLAAEALVGLEILVAAAALTAASPARGPEFAVPRAAPAPLLVRELDDVLVTVTARPNRPGANVVTVAAVSSRRPPPAAIDGVRLRSGRGPAVALHRLEAGRWTGGTVFAQPGRRPLTVELDRAGRTLRAAFGWPVSAPDAARPVVVSARPLAPLLNGAAASLVLAAAALLIAAALRRRPSPARAVPLIEQLGKEAP